MKKIFQTTLLGVAIFFLQGNIVPGKQQNRQLLVTQTNNNKEQRLLTYYWYADEDYSVYTGYNNSINTELQRLRNTYPSYMFSSTPGTGMAQFEFGYNPFFIEAIIYSNMNFQ